MAMGSADYLPPSGADLARQPSAMLAMTLEDFQQQGINGRSFDSMKLDEFLQHMISKDQEGFLASLPSVTPQEVQDALPPSAAANRQNSLQRQNSLSLPMHFSGKTADEVWREIVQEAQAQQASQPPSQQQQQQLGQGGAGTTLQQDGAYYQQGSQGGTTLQEFLGKVGVYRNWADVPEASAPQDGTLPVITFYDPATTYTAPVEPKPPRDQHAAEARAARQRKRKEQEHSGTEAGPAGEGLDDRTARMQKRMVKNRESAARSRQRKQAYTQELEDELEKLKQKNKEMEVKVAAVAAMAERAEKNARRQGPATKLRRTATIG